MGVVTITKENFEAEVVGAKVPVVIDFWASWCGPCQMQSPVVDAVAESMGDQVKVCKVNVDEQPQLALNYQIVSIPTLVFMKDGMFQKKMVGLQTKDAIEDYLKTLLDASQDTTYNKRQLQGDCLFLFPHLKFCIDNTNKIYYY